MQISKIYKVTQYGRGVLRNNKICEFDRNLRKICISGVLKGHRTRENRILRNITHDYVITFLSISAINFNDSDSENYADSEYAKISFPACSYLEIIAKQTSIKF